MCLPTVAQADQLNGDVNAYNTNVEAKNWSLTQRLIGLKKIFTQVYALFNAAGSGLPLWPAHDRQRQLVALEAAAEAEFAKVVKLCVADEEPPLLTQVGDPQFDGQRYDAAGKLWKRFVRGDVAVQVYKNDARLMAMVARILDVPLGAELLRELFSRDRPVLICDYTPKEWLPVVLKADSAVAELQVVLVERKSGVKPTEALRQSKCWIRVTTAPAANVVYTPIVGAPGLWNAILTHQAGVSFTVGGVQKYGQFAEGSLGCVIQMLGVGEGSDTNADTTGSLVHTPDWLTLAHELAHGLTHISGAASATPDMFTYYLNPPGQDDVSTWTNGEEFLVITVVENGFRQWVGLTRRGAHKSLRSAEDILIETTHTEFALFMNTLKGSQLEQAQALAQDYLKNKARDARLEWCKKAKAFMAKYGS